MNQANYCMNCNKNGACCRCAQEWKGFVSTVLVVGLLLAAATVYSVLQALHVVR